MPMLNLAADFPHRELADTIGLLRVFSSCLQKTSEKPCQ
jgi:hypothetical protein